MNKTVVLTGQGSKVLNGEWKTRSGKILSGEALKHEIAKPAFEIENACWWITGHMGRASVMLHKKSMRKVKLERGHHEHKTGVEGR
jgi:hypothetical protein